MRNSVGFITAVSVVAGSVIGTGVFLKPATMAANAQSVPWVLTAWLLAGLLSYAGALTYAELCSRYPEAGGEYAFLREAYGDFAAYLFGWMRFTIGAPGSAASYAVGAATFLHAVIPYEASGIRIWQVAVGFVLVFTIINSVTIWVSASVQVGLTALKIISIAAIVVTLVFFTPAHTSPSPAAVWPGMVSFSAAILAALWAYDGWNNLPMLGAEVRNGRKNLPLALAIGMAVVIFVYLALNAAFFRVLDFSEVTQLTAVGRSAQTPVATAALSHSIAGASVKVIAAVLVVSALGAMNGSILSSARVPYAMARDGVFFRPLATLSPKRSIPVISTLTQGGIAVILAASGTFDQLTDSVVFISWIFYALTASTLFHFRRQKTAHAAFLSPFYPVLPVMFIVLSAGLTVYTVLAQPALTLLGLGIVTAGIPLYFWFARRKGAAQSDRAQP